MTRLNVQAEASKTVRNNLFVSGGEEIKITETQGDCAPLSRTIFHIWVFLLKNRKLLFFSAAKMMKTNDNLRTRKETEPTKGSLTAISTTDVFTEGCLLSAEQSHT